MTFTDGKNKLTKVDDPTAYPPIDRWDEEQILAELRGEVISEYVYEFSQDGRQVRGLSWAGTKEVSRQAGQFATPLEKMRIVEWKDHEGEIKQEVVVEVIDTATNVSRLGSAQIEPLMRLKNKTTRADKFAFTKALSKAQRNGLRHHIPEAIVIKLIAEFVKKGKVGTRELPPSEPDGPPSDLYVSFSDEIKEAKTPGILKEVWNRCQDKRKEKKLTAGEATTLQKEFMARLQELGE